MTTTGGTRGEWALTDSAFHVGGGACDALVRLAAANPGAFAGVEVCAYGDFMQPMGADPAWAEGDAFAAEEGEKRLATDASEKARRLSAARALLASALRSRPLLVLPLLPSRFVHVGTMPELVHHACADRDVLAALPAAEEKLCRGELCHGSAGRWRPISWFAFNPATRNTKRYLLCDACREKKRIKLAEKRAAEKAARAE